MHVGESAHPGFAPLFAGKKKVAPSSCRLQTPMFLNPSLLRNYFNVRPLVY
jgi:hypothetical protein